MTFSPHFSPFLESEKSSFFTRNSKHGKRPKIHKSRHAWPDYQGHLSDFRWSKSMFTTVHRFVIQAQIHPMLNSSEEFGSHWHSNQLFQNVSNSIGEFVARMLKILPFMRSFWFNWVLKLKFTLEMSSGSALHLHAEKSSLFRPLSTLRLSRLNNKR